VLGVLNSVLAMMGSLCGCENAVNACLVNVWRPRDRDTPSLWKLPDTPRHTPAYSPFGMKTTRHARQAELNDLELWIDLARTVERAAIDAAFFADVIGPSHHIDGPSTSSSRPGAAHHRRGDRAAD